MTQQSDEEKKQGLAPAIKNPRGAYTPEAEEAYQKTTEIKIGTSIMPPDSVIAVETSIPESEPNIEESNDESK